ncbi:alanine racemase [Anditalea andensis]|uniref:Amidophosphoribosyltransferase n=1 Tax=Anditalea andensis TaxID=1048983 RepID=A0A074LEX6_9BACT|nr:alanine racemase [Anditalea andensis]KEO72347.1 amidophosphoribosyltransferase [Anditalea andensis]
MEKLEVKNPTLILDEKICRQNLSNMAERAKKHGLKLVPHFKTHQSLLIGEWYKDYGVQEITVSSFKMAYYFKDKGFSNIHIAFPFNPLLISDLNGIQDQSISIQLVNEEVTKALATDLTKETGFFIEIDTGYGRTGVPIGKLEEIDAILREASFSHKLKFKGFYIHAGHSYYADLEGIHKIQKEIQEAFRILKAKYKSQYTELVCRSGDTPTCSIMDDFEYIDEIGPGNFVFYDITQAEIGSCSREDIAIILAAPVVDIKKGNNEILIHAGGVHLSKDVLNLNGHKNFGEVVYLNELGWEHPTAPSYLKSISQEHGTIHASAQLMDSIKIGDIIGILPIHSCMTADCMKEYKTLNGRMVDHLEGRGITG